MQIPRELVNAARQAGAKDALRVASGIVRVCADRRNSPHEALEQLFNWQPELFWPKRARAYFKESP